MKDGQSIGPYHLPRLQEIVVPVASANIMVPHSLPELKQKQKHYHGIPILGLYHRHLRKTDRALACTIGPGLQEIVVQVAAANIMVLHSLPALK